METTATDPYTDLYNEGNEKLVLGTQCYSKHISNMHKQTFNEIVRVNEKHIKVIGKEGKSRNWKKFFFSILDKWKSFINKANPCNPCIDTKNNFYRAGKTASRITTSSKVKTIRWKENKLQEIHTNEPTHVSIHDSDLILMRYTAQAMEEYKGHICDNDLNLEYLKAFPEMGLFIFDFIDSGDNWKRARDVVLNEIKMFDPIMSQNLSHTFRKDIFFKEILSCYLTNHIYTQLNRELRMQATTQRNKYSNFKAYCALANAILFLNFLNLPVCTQTTYRGMRLSKSEIEKYTEGKEFAWLSFTSSTATEENSFYKNCKFIIDNSKSCVWSPRGIASISNFPEEDEYLYPCGAQFRVMRVEEENGITTIHLKLICKTEPRQFVSIAARNLESKGIEIKKAIATLIKTRRELEILKKRLLIICREIEKNAIYETWIFQNIERKKILELNRAYICTKCNYHYPSPNTDMDKSSCIKSINKPIIMRHCKKCLQNCHFSSHKKANYIYIAETIVKVNERMKARFDRAKIQERSEEKRVELKNCELKTAIQEVRTKLCGWDVLTQRFDEKLNQEQVATRAEFKGLLKQYFRNKKLVQASRSRLGESELLTGSAYISEDLSSCFE